MSNWRLGWRFIKRIDILPHYAGGVAAPQALHGKRGLFSRVREWPPLDPPRERKGPCPLTPHIGSLYLEELHALRNQVRCTWLRHESLRVVTILNRALLS